MTIASEGLLRSTRRAIMTSSRNLAVLSTVGVVGGTILFFEFLKRGEQIPRADERVAYHGSSLDEDGQTDQGTAKRGRIRLKNYNERHKPSA